ncbi:hypothetical protein ACHAWF_002715 [Thalassiosira exigua]
MDNSNLSTHNPTVPTTVGALLAEESTIDPLSHLPSFLELTFVDVARDSGRKALSAAWAMGITWLEGALERLRRLEGILDRVATRANAHEGSRPTEMMLVIRALATRLARLRVRILRRVCHISLRTVKSLGPELQTLIMFAIDYNCMHHLAGATACEMVYGLKRSKIVKARHPMPTMPSTVPLSPTKQKLPLNTNNSLPVESQATTQGALNSQFANKVADLSKFEKTCSALLAAMLPYWKERCDWYYNECKEESHGSVDHTSNARHNNIRTNQSTLDNAKDNFLRIYPYAHLVHEGSIFLYQFAYLMGYTPYWSFSTHSLGVMLRRMTVTDVQQQQKKKQQSTILRPAQPPTRQEGTNAPSTQISQPRAKLTIPQLVRGAILFSFSYTLLSGWYSHFQQELRLRRRRWIAGEDSEPIQTHRGASNDEESSRNTLRHPIPPPPLPPIVMNESESAIGKWSCPICKEEPRINPTASTSGYVFCYKCLVTHLRQIGDHCPVTGMSCRENEVVRIYEPTASRRTATSSNISASNMQ